MATELQQRVHAATPKWFKRIRKIGLIVSAVAGALITAGATMPGFVLPAVVNTICQWITVAGITASTVATTAKEDK